MRSFTVKTQHHTQFVRIDREVQQIVTETGIKDGVCHVFVPHTTAGITINENADPDVVRDIINTLDRLVPWDLKYAHVEGNSAAHVKASMMGFSQAVIIEGGRLRLGTWQSLYFCEFDGPRSRNVWVQVIQSA
jgi:secondary thiamine-phosphate synthase enzyme